MTSTPTTEHLTVLHERLSHEKTRLANAKSESEKSLRTVWVAQMEKEVQDEIKFLADRGVYVPQPDAQDLEVPDDELLRLLNL
jgi:hypothetical protein